jgi:4-hydroxybenzoate polyprenyltransferase
MILFRLLRISSWLKNGFVIAPLIYSLKLLEISALNNSILAFLVYSFASSSLYIINDIIDKQKDLLHPRKKNRPIPSGKININLAIGIAAVLFILAIYIAQSISIKFLGIITLFIINNILYSFWWKNANLLDSFSIGISFVLRTIGGCMAIDVIPSTWIIIITFTLSLFLIFIKRKSEIEILGENAVKHRKVLQYYSIEILNHFIFITAAITITAYILYSINQEVNDLLGTNLLVYSSFFVFLGVFRFIQLSFLDKYSHEGDPTTLLIKDRFTQINILFYIIFIVSIIYF